MLMTEQFLETTVIGLGEIGSELIQAISNYDSLRVFDIRGVDIDRKKVRLMSKKYPKYSFTTKIERKDPIYFISVWTTEQVLEVIKNLPKDNDPLIIIESTVMPGTAKKIKKLYPELNFVLFPHRYNGGDKEHNIFNLDRVIGGSSDYAVQKTINLLETSSLMKSNLIHKTSLEIAELCKPMENAYRYAEIALAEQIRLMAENKGINFEDLRRAMNTKWNINVLEARDGIGKHCLPKDIKIINKYFENDLFKACHKLNSKYVKKYGRKPKN